METSLTRDAVKCVRTLNNREVRVSSSMDREEKRRQLRAKIAERRGQRTNQGPSQTPSAQALRRDPASALVNMIDDADMLREATRLASNPDLLRTLAKNLKQAERKEVGKVGKVGKVERPNERPVEDESDEEAPPE